MNREAVYSSIRQSLFGGHLSQSQVDGINAILDEWERRQLTEVRWLAYILATVYHEVGRTMQPIEETPESRKGRDYNKKLKMGNGPGKRIPYTTPDKLYYGRGLTQNTWYENYEALTRAAKKQGNDWDFLNHPELLLHMQPSIWATFHAMTTGLYTGKKLSDYFNGATEKPIKARYIVNGKDRAELIAGYYYKFLEALK